MRSTYHRLAPWLLPWPRRLRCSERPPPARARRRRCARGRRPRARSRRVKRPGTGDDGAGDGHGVGMSQEGALGYAEHGWQLSGDPGPLLHRHRDRSGARGTRSCACWSAGRCAGCPGTLRARRGLGRDAGELAARRAGGTGGRQPHLRAHRARRGIEVRRVRRHALAGLSAASPPKRRRRTPPSPRPRGRSSPTLAAGDHLLLRQLRRDDRKRARTPGPAPNRSHGCSGVPDPYDSGPLHRWKLSMSFAAAAARLRGLVEGSLARDRGADARRLAADPVRRGARHRAARPRQRRRTGAASGCMSTWAYFSVRNGHSRQSPSLIERSIRRSDPGGNAAADQHRPAGRRRGARRHAARSRRRRRGRLAPSIHLPAPLIAGQSRFRWTDICWMLEG